MSLKFFIDRPVLSGVLSVMIVFLGVIGLFRIPAEQFPEIAPPAIRVSAVYPGASAETLQRAVVVPLEEAVNGAENINYMTSTASNTGTATITVYFRRGTDPDMAAVNVQNRIAAAQGLLPAETVGAGISVRKSQNGTAKIVSLYSPDDSFDGNFLGNYFRINVEPQLARIRGAGAVTLFGPEYALRIWLKPDRMFRFGLVPADIFSAIEEQNLEVPAGTLGAESDAVFQYVLKYRGRLEHEKEFENLVVKSLPDGGVLRLRDVADVELGALDYSVRSELAGHPAANCMISLAPGANANDVVREIDEVVRAAAENLPKGMAFAELMSVKNFLDASFFNVARTLVEAIALVTLVVLIFLRDVRAALVPFAAISVSVVGTFGALYFIGFTLNMLTLFALVLAIGTVVDDAIVVAEAVQSELDRGAASPYAAAVGAMRGLTRALLTTTLIFMSVFVPVCFVGGAAGTFYTQFGVTMTAAVCISAVNALTLSPALCAMLMRPNAGGKRSRRGAFPRVVRGYGACVFFFLRRRALAGTLAVAAVLAFLYLFFNTKTGFVPDEDTGTVVVDVQTSPGTSLSRTEKIMEEIEARVKATPQVQIYSKSVGTGMLAGQSPSAGTFIIRLKPWRERGGRDDGHAAVVADLRRRLDDVAEARIAVFSQPIIAGYGVSDGFEVHVTDRRGGSIEALQRDARNFIDALNARPEIARAQTTFDARSPQYLVEADAELCRRSGISPADVLDALSAYVGGVYSSNINRFSKIYRVVVQASPEYRLNADSLDEIFVRTADGEMMPASRCLKLRRVYGAESLTRFNLFPSIAVRGVPARGFSSGQAIEAIRETASRTLPLGVGFEFGAMTREEASAGNGAVLVFAVCVVFIYLILCALYESLLIPFAVILSVPFGLAGSFLAARIFDMENNIYMQTGVIMLIGLLAKTAVLMTESASERRSRGMSVPAAAWTAARARLRPILMTSATMIFGLLPMIFASGAGANGSRSLAVGTVGGMLTGTAALLLVVPVFWLVCRNLRERKFGFPRKNPSLK